MSFQTGTTSIMTHKVVGGISTQNVGANRGHMAPLIRAPVLPIPMASGFKGSKILESAVKSQKKSPKPSDVHHRQSLVQSKLDFTSSSNETRRREKLRAVLAMMGSSTKGRRNRRDSRLKVQESSTTEEQDVLSELKPEPKATSTSMLTVGNLLGKSKRSKKGLAGRRMSIVSDNSTHSSDRGRRGAILQGKLPVKSFPDDESNAKMIAEESSKKWKKPKVKVVIVKNIRK